MKYVTREDDISALGMSVRVTNCLNKIQVRTIGAFLEYPEDQFAGIRNLGITSLKEIARVRAELIDQSGSRYRLVDQIDLPKQEPQSVGAEELSTPVLLYDLPVSEMQLSVRAMNCLNRAGWTNASQLVGKSLDDLLAVKNMGRKTAEEIMTAVSGLSIGLSGANPGSDSSPQDGSAALLAEELAAVFGGMPSSWLPKLEKLRGGEMLDRDAMLGMVFKEKEIRTAQKKAICDYLENHEDQAPVAEIIDYMQTRLANGAMTVSLVDELLGEGKAVRNGSSVVRVYPCAREFAESLRDDRQREILLARFGGKTLEEVASLYSLTRERVRQIQTKALRDAPRLAEDKYRYAFEKYYFSKEDFHLAFDEPDETFCYLEIVTGRKQTDTKPLEEALEDERLSVAMRRQIERAVYKQYVTVDGRRILKKRPDLVRYVVSQYCREQTDFTDFLALYGMVLEDLGLYGDPSLTIESRAYENQLNACDYALWLPGKRLRYYNIQEHDFDGLLSNLNLGQYTDAALSTLLLYRQFPELMREYDIRDEYELHNLLKKIWNGRKPEIIFSRNPIFFIGNGSHANQALELLMQYAPIGWQELSKKYEEVYGMRADSAGANILSCLREYYHNGLFSIDAPALPPEQFSVMHQLLTEDFYTISEVNRIFFHRFPDADDAYINPYSLKTLGFHVFSGYIISKRYSSASEYFDSLLTECDITDLRDINPQISILSAYLSELSALRKAKVIIEYEPHRLIHIRRLEAGGVTKEELIDYCDQVLKWVGSDQIFTIHTLRKSGFAHELDDLGFDDWFYSSLLCEDPRFSSRRMGGTRLLYSGNKAIMLENLLTDILLAWEKIGVYELRELLENDYGIVLDIYNLIELVKESSLYYDNIMETVYIDYDTYFEEI